MLYIKSIYKCMIFRGTPISGNHQMSRPTQIDLANENMLMVLWNRASLRQTQMEFHNVRYIQVILPCHDMYIYIYIYICIISTHTHMKFLFLASVKSKEETSMFSPGILRLFGCFCLPSGNLTQLWKIIMFNGKIHHNGNFQQLC